MFKIERRDPSNAWVTHRGGYSNRDAALASLQDYLCQGDPLLRRGEFRLVECTVGGNPLKRHLNACAIARRSVITFEVYAPIKSYRHTKLSKREAESSREGKSRVSIATSANEEAADVEADVPAARKSSWFARLLRSHSLVG